MNRFQSPRPVPPNIIAQPGDDPDHVNIKYVYHREIPEGGLHIYREEDGTEIRDVLIPVCGHYMTANADERFLRRIYGESWTHQTVCMKCLKACKYCHIHVCVHGDAADGKVFFPEDGANPYYLCTICHKEATKNAKRKRWLYIFLGKRGPFDG